MIYNINPNISHITCQICGKSWQVLNEEGTDWDEQKTAEGYHAENHNCQPPTKINSPIGEKHGSDR